MNQKLRGEAEQIMEYAIGKMQPDAAVVRALEACSLSGRIYLAAVGKAAWRMANAAAAHLETPVADGVVVTKYGHAYENIIFYTDTIPKLNSAFHCNIITYNYIIFY